MTICRSGLVALIRIACYKDRGGDYTKEFANTSW